MLEPLRIPYIKTFKEFKERNLELLPEQYFLRSDNPGKALREAIFSGKYFMITPCKAFKLNKERSCAADKKLTDGTYIIEEPFASNAQNLLVPFTNPYVDKFQGNFK